MAAYQQVKTDFFLVVLPGLLQDSPTRLRFTGSTRYPWTVGNEPMTTQLTATDIRSEGWWAVSVPEVDGLFTQTRSLDEIPAVVRDALTLFPELPVPRAWHRSFGHRDFGRDGHARILSHRAPVPGASIAARDQSLGRSRRH